MRRSATRCIPLVAVVYAQLVIVPGAWAQDDEDQEIQEDDSEDIDSQEFEDMDSQEADLEVAPPPAALVNDGDDSPQDGSAPPPMTESRPPATVHVDPARRALAEALEAPEEEFLFQAEDRIVTVTTRDKRKVREAPGIVTVISGRELYDLGVLNLADALALIPGVFTTRSWLGNHLAYVRGTQNSNHNSKLVLMRNGVAWRDGLFNHAPLGDYIPLIGLDRVEIVKGPASGLYGANAFAGALNLVSLEPGEREGGEVRIEAGAFERMQVDGLWSTRFDTPLGLGGINVWFRTMDDGGDGMRKSRWGTERVHAGDPKKAQSAGFVLRTGDLHFSYHMMNYHHIAWQQEEDDFFDIVFQSVDIHGIRNQDHFFSTHYDLQLPAQVQVTPRAYYQLYDERTTFGWIDETGESLTLALKRTSRLGAGIEVRHSAGKMHTLLLGLDHSYDYIDEVIDLTFDDLSAKPLDPPKFMVPNSRIGNTGVYGQEIFKPMDWATLMVGARADKHSAFGLNISPRAALVLTPGNAFGVKLLYGEAFRPPNPRELLAQTSINYVKGNPDLKPETIRTGELEVSYRPNRNVALRVAGFYNEGKDEIERQVNVPQDEQTSFENTGGYTVQGLESELTLAFSRALLKASYTFTRSRIPFDPALPQYPGGRRTYEIPSHMASLIASVRPTRHIKAIFSGNYVHTRPRLEWSPNLQIPDGEPYYVLHLTVLIDDLLEDRLALSLAIRNLLNEEYVHLRSRQDADRPTNDNEAPGRNILLRAHYRF